MIKKLEPYNSSKSSIDGYHWEIRPNMEDVINKVNEIIDAVNANSFGFSMPFGHKSVLGERDNYTKSVKHGQWLLSDGVRCSICNNKLQTIGLPSYCPNCGAKMDGGK